MVSLIAGWSLRDVVPPGDAQYVSKALGMRAFKRLNDNYQISKLNDSLNEHGGGNRNVFNISFSTFVMSVH